jgi:hypothetical protein
MARHGVGVIDPKGDLISNILERLPARHRDRVVLIDPARRDFPVGLNVLDHPPGVERELVCDQVVTIFRKNFQQYWGPRTDDVLRAALLTILRHPGKTLTEVPLLLLNDAVRAKLTRGLDDPAGLTPFWHEYGQMSVAQRLQVAGPVLNKLRAFLLRPTIRNMLGQSQSTVDFRTVMDQGGILLVSLAKGSLGEETSRLLGSFIVARLWQAALSRIDQPEAERVDFNLYLDEFQNYLHLPNSLEEVLAEARGYRLNLTLANQHLGQLTPAIAQAVDANTRTRIVFQCGQEDARHLARTFAPLTDHQLQSLARYQVAIRLCVDGHTEPPFTGTTEAPPPGFGEAHAAATTESSLRRYGRPVAEVEREIASRFMSAGGRGGFTDLGPGADPKEGAG